MWPYYYERSLGRVLGRSANGASIDLVQGLVEGLAVSHAHGLKAGRLPPHHRDPFDRMLVAQAQLERMPLLTVDRQISLYDVEVIEAT